jgi:hypothetical protein
MATVSVRGRGVARVQPDELTVGLPVAEVDVTFQLEQP